MVTEVTGRHNLPLLDTITSLSYIRLHLISFDNSISISSEYCFR